MLKVPIYLTWRPKAIYSTRHGREQLWCFNACMCTALVRSHEPKLSSSVLAAQPPEAWWYRRLHLQSPLRGCSLIEATDGSQIQVDLLCCRAAGSRVPQKARRSLHRHLWLSTKGRRFLTILAFCFELVFRCFFSAAKTNLQCLH